MPCRCSSWGWETDRPRRRNARSPESSSSIRVRARGRIPSFSVRISGTVAQRVFWTKSGNLTFRVRVFPGSRNGPAAPRVLPPAGEALFQRFRPGDVFPVGFFTTHGFAHAGRFHRAVVHTAGEVVEDGSCFAEMPYQGIFSRARSRPVGDGKGARPAVACPMESFNGRRDALDREPRNLL